MSDTHTYTNAQYISGKDGENHSIRVNINGNELPSYVSIVEGNRHYAEIMRQVEAGELTVADAE